MKTVEHEIGSKELDKWISISIQNSLSLSKAVQRHFNLESARKSTSYFRREFSETLEFYEQGCLCHEYPEISNEARNWIIQKCLTYLGTGSHRICIFEDWTWSDKAARIHNDPNNPPFFTSDNFKNGGYEIYYFADSANASYATINAEIDLSGSAGPYCVGVLAQLPENISIKNGLQVGGNILYDIAKLAEYLIFGAFDLEGFIWVQLKVV